MDRYFQSYTCSRPMHALGLSRINGQDKSRNLICKERASRLLHIGSDISRWLQALLISDVQDKHLDSTLVHTYWLCISNHNLHSIEHPPRQNLLNSSKSRVLQADNLIATESIWLACLATRKQGRAPCCKAIPR